MRQWPAPAARADAIASDVAQSAELRAQVARRRSPADHAQRERDTGRLRKRQQPRRPDAEHRDRDDETGKAKGRFDQPRERRIHAAAGVAGERS